MTDEKGDIHEPSGLTEAQIDNIKNRLAKATPGPWRDYIEKRDQISGSDFIQTDGDDIYILGGTQYDLEFIASARQDMDLLISEIERLRRRSGS